MTPATVDLFGVWVGGLGDAYAVGDHATVLHYDGKAWVAVVVSAPDIPLRAVWGSDPANVFAVGDNGTAVQVAANMSVDTTSPGDLTSVWGSGASDVFAVGAVTLPSSGVIRHFDGASWTTVTPPPARPLYAVGGSGPNDVYAVGAGGIVLHFDGTWTTKVAYSSTGPVLHAVWVNGPDDFTVAGGTSQGTIIHYVAGTPRIASLANSTPGLTSLWGDGAGVTYAAGAGATLLGTVDGDNWSPINPPAGAGNPDLTSIGGSAGSTAVPANVFAVGTLGSIWHYDGK
jgi:hypothetical protein